MQYIPVGNRPAPISGGAMATIVAWILEPTPDLQCQQCLTKPAQLIVALDDEITTSGLCDDCVPEGAADPIGNVLKIALSDEPPPIDQP